MIFVFQSPLNNEWCLAYHNHNKRKLPSKDVLSLQLGYLYGYRECCIFQFTNDRAIDLPPGLLRGDVSGPFGGTMVPCWQCKPKQSKSKEISAIQRSVNKMTLEKVCF